jgi:hypothetical protein
VVALLLQFLVQPRRPIWVASFKKSFFFP